MMTDSPDVSSHLPALPPPWKIAAAFAIIYLSWGTTYLATTIAMAQEHMPAALFGGVRLIIAGTILLTVQFCRGQSLRITMREASGLLAVSWCLFLGANLLINIGQREVPSGVAAVLIATTPLWMGLFGILMPAGERLSWRGWLGLSFGFVGMLFTMAPALRGGFSLLNDFHTLFVVGSAASWAAGSLLSRHLAIPLPHLTSAGFQMLFGGLSQACLAAPLLGEWHTLPETISPRAIGCFLYLLVFGSLLGFVAFNWLLGHVSAAKVGTYAYINPIIAVFIGACVGEPLHGWLFAGIVIILVSVYLIRSDKPQSQEIELEPD
ncbi:MAG: hypothetical protein EXS16_00615 [Gemmataceae bacterium]|nr:hypothetical protein [Gemmataceae bacterium]